MMHMIFSEHRQVSQKYLNFQISSPPCSNQVLLTKDSPIEYLLVGADAYPGSVYPSETLEGAVSALRSASEEAVLLTDAGTADRIVLRVRFFDLIASVII